MEIASKERTVLTIIMKTNEAKGKGGGRVRAERNRPKVVNVLHPGPATSRDVQEADKVDNHRGVPNGHLQEVAPEVNQRVHVPEAPADHHEGREVLLQGSVPPRVPMQMVSLSFVFSTKRDNALLVTIAGTAMMIAGKGANRSNANLRISVRLSLDLGPEAPKVRKALATENQNGNQIPKVSQESHRRRMVRFLLSDLFPSRLSAPDTVAKDLFEHPVQAHTDHRHLHLQVSLSWTIDQQADVSASVPKYVPESIQRESSSVEGALVLLTKGIPNVLDNRQYLCLVESALSPWGKVPSSNQLTELVVVTKLFPTKVLTTLTTHVLRFCRTIVIKILERVGLREGEVQGNNVYHQRV